MTIAMAMVTMVKVMVAYVHRWVSVGAMDLRGSDQDST